MDRRKIAIFNFISKIILLLLLLMRFLGFSQEKNQIDLDTVDYEDYYIAVNQAEEAYFVENEETKSLRIFEQVFKTYDFIFLTDIVTAAQIAKFENKPFKKYLKIGFKYGLKLDHLKNYPIFKEELESLTQDSELKKAFKESRKEYMEAVDFDYLKWTYKVFLKDQKDKNMPKYEDYLALLNREIKQFEQKIRKQGFPGERIIGVADSTIFKEKGIWQLDLAPTAKRKQYKYIINTDDAALSPTAMLIYLVHHPCAYQKLEKLLKREMLKGNIHPRSVALLYDNTLRFSTSRSRSAVKNYCRTLKKTDSIFRINQFASYPPLTEQSLKETDKLRKEFYIVPLAVDLKKREYQKDHGFILFTRFWDAPKF